MKNLWLMRHAQPVHGHPMDATRELTADGVKQAEDMGEWLRTEFGRVDIVITSPFARAMHTAQIMADKLGSHVADTRLLEPDASPEDAWKEVERLAQQSKDVLIVGHDPMINALLMWLLGLKAGVPEVRFEHASIAYVDTRKNPATLKWLVTPDLVLDEEAAEVEEAAAALADLLSKNESV